MAREKENFRDNLERLDRAFPETEILTVKQVCAYTGFRSPNTVKKHYPFQKGGYISKVALARAMS